VDKFLIFTIVGLSTAAIYAIIASGLVVTYTTTGIFNFAHGATGMLAAFVYWQLTVKWHWPILIAIPFVLLVMAPLSACCSTASSCAGSRAPAKPPNWWFRSRCWWP
jgi:branched-chain amino acid transport system permease protein